MSSYSSKVSVVIPTRNRPELVVRAVHSALRQTYSDLEVNVVVDGADPITQASLASIQDERLRVIMLESSLGGSGARNAGVEAARGEWVAFLDDDDEWLPSKLERQMRLATNTSSRLPVVSCSVIARTPTGEYVWPRKFPCGDKPLSEYLFCRNSPFQGDSFLQTSTVVARRNLLLDMPFRILKKHQDWDWFLRVAQLPGFAVEFVRDPLVIFHTEEARPGISNRSDWQFSLNWLRTNRALFTGHSFASFLLVIVNAQAKLAPVRIRAAFLREAIASGNPSMMDIALFFGLWATPVSARRRLRALLTGQRSQREVSS